MFDLDGTLADSLEDIAIALDAAMIDNRLPAPTRAQVRGWVGSGARNLVLQAVGPQLVEPVLARFRVHYADKPIVFTKLYPGVDAALDRLAAAGVELAVLSNKPDALTQVICAALLQRWRFDVIAGHREGMPLKPAAEPALAVAAALQIAPRECAFVGDTPIDIATARAAGMAPIAVTWGFRSRELLVAAEPALVIDDPAQLAQIASYQISGG